MSKQWLLMYISHFRLISIKSLLGGIFSTGCSDASSSDKNTVRVGNKVPAFTRLDQDANSFSRADYIGKKKMVFYFYPEDESRVCTQEACAFRDSFTAFEDIAAVVVRINFGLGTKP